MAASEELLHNNMCNIVDIRQIYQAAEGRYNLYLSVYLMPQKPRV